MYKWIFTARDNSGYFQNFIVTAGNKPDAIKKGMIKARKNAHGDIINWNCKLNNY